MRFEPLTELLLPLLWNLSNHEYQNASSRNTTPTTPLTIAPVLLDEEEDEVEIGVVEDGEEDRDALLVAAAAAIDRKDAGVVVTNLPSSIDTPWCWAQQPRPFD